MNGREKFIQYIRFNYQMLYLAGISDE